MAEKYLAVRLHSLGDVVLASGTVSAMADAGKTVFATAPLYAPIAERIPGSVTVEVVSGWRDLRKAAEGFTKIVDLQNNLTTGIGLWGKKALRYSFQRRKRKSILLGADESMEWRALEYMQTAGLSGDPAPVLIRKRYPAPGDTAVGIVIGGRWPMKALPDGVVTELARLFCDVLGARVYLIGAEQDREQAEAAAEECGYRNVVSVAGEGGIEKLLERIEVLNLLVSPDSGPAHIGIALGVPTLVVFTATSPALGFYRKDYPGAFTLPGVPCRPCHRHGGIRCREGDEQCRRRLIPRQIFQEAVCLMQ